MALDCGKCIKKHSVSSTRGHCSEFIDMPQVEACSKMDLGPSKSGVDNHLPDPDSRPSYLWLKEAENNRPTLGH